MNNKRKDIDPVETKEWIESLKSIINNDGVERANYIIKNLLSITNNQNKSDNVETNTDYINTIPISKQNPYR